MSYNKCFERIQDLEFVPYLKNVMFIKKIWKNQTVCNACFGYCRLIFFVVLNILYVYAL